MVRHWLIVIAMLAGCRQLAGLDDPLPGDGGGSGSGSFCYGKGLVQVCFSDEPKGDVVMSTNPIDTGGFGCATNVISGNGPCYIQASTITLPAGTTTPATGTLPLVFVATNTITISGTLDAAAHHQQQTSMTPPGGNFTGCQSGTNPMNGTYGGGGQGGSFLAKGGDGGDGGSGMGGTAGTALATPTTLHAGCAGHSGAGSSSGGGGGKGGGATYLIAVGSIMIDGRLDASGGGGTNNDNDNSGVGGGAGGAGGMIGLDAQTVVISGAVCAIGGSGASGAVGTAGQNGSDATGNTTACTVGIPGAGGGGAGSGGAGATNGAGVAGGMGTGGGGGGGGGSSGYIKIYGTRSGSGAVQPMP